jgi:hypothetical protein
MTNINDEAIENFLKEIIPIIGKYKRCYNIPVKIDIELHFSKDKQEFWKSYHSDFLKTEET